VAVPHPREPLETPAAGATISACFLDQPVDFKAVDERPVFVLFVLLCPSVQSHLHLLSRLAFCLRDDRFTDFLRQVPPAAALLERIADFEAHLESRGL
jgi:PTS system nitrogen regulatory IIA component